MTSLGVLPVSAFAPSRIISIPVWYFWKALSKSDGVVLPWLMWSSSVCYSYEVHSGATLWPFLPDLLYTHFWILVTYDLNWWTSLPPELLRFSPRLTPADHACFQPFPVQS